MKGLARHLRTAFVAVAWLGLWIAMANTAVIWHGAVFVLLVAPVHYVGLVAMRWARS